MQLNIPLSTGDILQWDSFAHIEEPAKLFNKLLHITGSYTKTKEILREQYRVFILIKN